MNLKKFHAEIAHLREHQDKFNKLFPDPPRDVERYLTRYGGLDHTELYERVCKEMGIEPK